MNNSIDGIIDGAWVVGVNSESAESAWLVQALYAKARGSIPNAPHPSQVVCAPDELSATGPPTIRFGHRQGGIDDDRSLYTLTAVLDGSEEDVSVRRARDASFCTACDVLVIVTRTETTADREVLATASGLQKPVVWAHASEAGTEILLSAAVVGPDPAQFTLAGRFGELDEHWLDAWWDANVLPALSWQHAAARALKDDPHQSGHSENLSGTAALDELAQTRAPSGTVSRWFCGLAGAWNRLLRASLEMGPIQHAPNRPIGFVARLRNTVPVQCLMAFVGRRSLNAPTRDFCYAGTATAGLDLLPLLDDGPSGDVFDLCDERANIDSGRYRSAAWLGYLLAATAILAATLGAPVISDALHANSAESHPGIAAHFWVGLVAALTAAFMLLAKLRVVGAATLCISAVVVVLVGGSMLTWNHEIGLASVTELASLVIILALVRMVWSLRAHEGWLATRTLAEAIRAEHMLHPVLSVSRNHRAPAFRVERGELRLVDGHAWWMARIRATRPLPVRHAIDGRSTLRLSDREHVLGYIGYLRHLLERQIGYHHGRSHSDHRLEHRLHLMTTWSFVLAALCAAAHSLHWGDAHLLLIGSVAFPAYGAALHAIATQLELGRHAQASAAMHAALDIHRAELKSLHEQVRLSVPPGTDVPWKTVDKLRSLAAASAETMSSNLREWHQLVAARAIQVMV